jgi:AraC-like DNA-binding protein
MKSLDQTNLASARAPEYFSPQVSAARRFYLNLTPPKRSPLAIISGGCEHCSSEYEIRRETFPYSSIEYVVRGRGALTLQNRAHSLQPGAVFSYGPGVRQDIIADRPEPPVKYFVDFAGTKSKEILELSQLPAGTVAQILPAHEIQSIFDELIRQGLRGSPRSPELCGKLLECMALEIAQARAPHQGVEMLSFLSYQQCRHHMEMHFHRLNTLREIAQECNLNAAYLCRLFQRYGHQSPYQYLLRLKMNQAAELLPQPGALVKQVAHQTGLADPFHFSRVFKKVFGLSPDTFRRQR